MLEAKMGEVLSNDKLAISSDMSNDSIVESREQTTKRTNMTNDEVASNAVLFFDAGYETTSTALSYVMHILVNHQEIQEKIRQEVKELIEDEGKLDYNTVTKLKFMEQVVYETMRVYPPVTNFVSRSPNIDYHYKDIVIPRGTDCRVPVYHLHRDPELWSEPEKFDPQRFSAENKHLINPVVWQPFGVGPRNCIGMRFALLEIKLALSQLLIKYKLVPSEKTELGDITRDFKVITMTPKYGIFTKAISLS
jgi:cytochrome P450 family 3 subfamily A